MISNLAIGCFLQNCLPNLCQFFTKNCENVMLFHRDTAFNISVKVYSSQANRLTIEKVFLKIVQHGNNSFSGASVYICIAKTNNTKAV